MRHNRGLTMVEALVVMFALTILLALGWAFFVPVRTSHRPSAWMTNNTQLRIIHQGMVMYAQGNNGYFPGLDHTGRPTGLAVEDRLKILLDGNYFTPEYLISPSETANKQAWAAGPFNSDHYSYAMLQVPRAGGRYEEWSETLNSQAIVLSDRNTGTAAAPSSLYDRNGQWRWGVAHNDNNVELKRTHRHATKYGDHTHADDHLFEAAGDDDAYLIHRGN